MKTALLSVSDKSGLVPFARGLADAGWHLLSTGGTAKVIRDAGISVQDVSDYTGDPEIFEGRVKTLNPKIHGAILWDRSKAAHKAAAAGQGIGTISLVAVNLYPFRRTVAAGGDFSVCIENIDIGGPALVRAAAKNHASVGVVIDPADYSRVLSEIQSVEGLSPGTRKQLAAKAFAHTAAYDAAVSGWFAGQAGEPFQSEISFAGQRSHKLRYGENPHQSAAFYKDGSARPGVATAEQIQGKALSYNNLNDTDAAFEAVCEFEDPAVVIVKHANPCGVATAPDGDLCAAYGRAYACDPVSAFGGIIALNRPLDGPTATRIAGIFTEVIIAPGIDDAARAVLASKPNLRLLSTGGTAAPDAPGFTYKSLSGGMLVQTRDAGRVTPDGLKTVTKRAPTADEQTDLLFAARVAKHLKSNAIVYAKDGATVGIGAGQMSRVDSSTIAARKAALMTKGKNAAKGSVVASDAFFPFADGLKAAIAAGATAVIQPGGSMRDDEVIAAADAAGIAMVFTGMRHFKH